MQIVPFLIGLVIFGAGIVFGILTYRKNHGRYQEMQYQRTSTLEDVVSVVDSMAAVDVTYRHYCELKGILQADAPVIAPFCEFPVAYYSNRCLSVTQQTQTVRDKDGNRHTFTTKSEQEVSSESSTAEIYVTDPSTGRRIYIDKQSYGDTMELMEGCDRFEPVNSPWMQNNMGRFQINFSFSGANHLGYRFVERILPQGQPVYLLGEVYKRGDRYYIGKAVREKKPSLLSFRTEEEIVKKAKSSRTVGLVVLIAAVLVGAGICVFSFTPACKQLMREIRADSYSDDAYGYYAGYDDDY